MSHLSDKAQELRAKGLTYHRIGAVLGVERGTAHRLVNGPPHGQRRGGDKQDIRQAITRALLTAWPGSLSRQVLDLESTIQGADKRTVQGALHSLASDGVILQLVSDERRYVLTKPAAVALLAATGKGEAA